MCPALSFFNFAKFLLHCVKIDKTAHKSILFGFYVINRVSICSPNVFVTFPDIFLLHGKPRGKTKI